MPLPVSSQEPPPHDDGERMQRIRVGVTGLAAVLLVVAVATAIASGVRRSADETAANVAPPAVVVTVDNSSSENEPLAQLGAAPGSNDDDANKAPKQ
jgi:hypothetical protein